MKKKTDEFISFMIDRNEFLKNDVKKCLEHWVLDAPAPILLFSIVGKSIVKHLSSFNEMRN